MAANRLKPLDLLVLAVTIILVGTITWRFLFSLNYQWNWQTVAGYLWQRDSNGALRPGLLPKGVVVTLRISLYAMILATVIGFIAGRLRTSPRYLYRLIGRSYVETIRNMPALVLLFIFYYFVSVQLLTLFGVEEWVSGLGDSTQQTLTTLFAAPALFTRFLSGVVALALFEGAYIAEIYRGGVESIARGQWEAAASLGLSRRQQLRRIIMPQAMQLMLPQLANEFINTVKWSSIVSFISIQELTYDGIQVIASTNATIEVWTVVALFYLTICLLLSAAVRRLERHYSTIQRR